jgi:hypothetical protein
MTDHEWYELVKGGEDPGWQLVWEKVVEPESVSMRSSELMKRHSITAGDLMGMLYEDMLCRRKIDLYRDDGGSFQGWLRSYVRGYVLGAGANIHGEISIDGGSLGADGESEVMSLPKDDHEVVRREVWQMTLWCFRELWNEDPERCYVHLLKTRFFFSSEEVRNFLDISSAANVDQIFSRSIKFMRQRYAYHDTHPKG